MWLDSQPYGRRVNATDIALYPEAGPDGNYRVYDQLPYKLFSNEWAIYFVGPMYSHGDPIAPWVNVHKKLDSMTLLFALALMGLISRGHLRRHKSGVRGSNGAMVRLIGFLPSAGVVLIAWLGAVFVYSDRFFMYSLPFLITLIFPGR
jgi:hypothetical protein